MSINHHVDLIIKFIDSYTDKPLINAYETFKLNGLPIMPSKKMMPYVIFADLINNHHYGKYGDTNIGHTLTWNHPYYEAITLSITDETEQLIRAIPNQNYPYPKTITAIKGTAKGSDLIEIIHQHSRNRFILKDTIVANKYIEMAQSYESELLGRKFLFSEQHHDQIITIETDNIGYYGIPNFEFPYTPACEIFEILEAIPQPSGQFMMPLKNLKSFETETLEFKINIHFDLKVKSSIITIKKDVINDVGEF